MATDTRRSDDEAAFTRARYDVERRVLSALLNNWWWSPRRVRAALGVTARDPLFVAAIRHLKATGKITCDGRRRGMRWRLA